MDDQVNIQTQELAPGQPVNTTSAKKRILIVEDEQAFRDVLSAELLKAGYEVISAVDGVEGLEKMRSGKPDLVLLDIIMPRKDGFGLLEDVKMDDALKSIPIIVLSNSGDLVELSHAKEMGVKDILVKTVFGPQELLARIEHVLAVTQPDANAQPTAQDEAKDLSAIPEINQFVSPPGSEINEFVPPLGSEINEFVSPLGSEITPPSQTPQPSSGGENAKGHVLVVEDDPFLWSLIQAKLTKEGFEVTVAREGQEALSMAKQIKPALILLDIILPDMNGFDVLKQLKDDTATKPVPVIILSNLDQQEDISKGMALGAKDYLIKAHHTPQEIADKIKQALAEKSN